MSSFRVRLLVLAAALALTASCTAQGAAPTSSDAATSAPGSASALSASPSSSPATSPGGPQSTSSGHASPSTPSSDATTSVPASADSEAALAAYRGFYALADRAYADPSADWSEEVKKWATGPAADLFLAGLASMAQEGQYASGTVRVEPTVTQVQPGLVNIQACLDATDSGLFNKEGQSIKAPDAPGTYFRHQSQAQVGQFEGGAWLVLSVNDDYSTSC